MCVYVLGQRRADGNRLPGSSIVGRESPNMGSGKQTQVLQKYMLSVAEPPLQPLSRYTTAQE